MLDYITAAIGITLGLGLVIWLSNAPPFKKITVFEYERGLKYNQGKFVKLLLPGQYWIWTGRTSITKVDIRPTFVTVPGQEVLTADSMPLKVSLAAVYEVTNPYTAVNRVSSYQTALYTTLQLALREIVGSSTIDDILQSRNQIGQQLLASAAPLVGEYGIRLISVNFKDIMLPGELKKIFAQVVQARQEGLASLERARGETAALRNLANAARLAAENPTLMQLRLIQSMEQSSGNTFVLGAAIASLLSASQAQENQNREG